MRRRATAGARAIAVVLTVLTLLATAAPVAAAPIRYIYDALGRLVGVIDRSGQTATYSYDPAGNLTAINVNSQVPSVADFSPSCAAPGGLVQVFGTGFAPSAGGNTVTINGLSATVSAVQPTHLVVVLPSGNTAGPIIVTTATGSASSAMPFGGSCGPPTIASFAPTSGVETRGGTPGTTVVITGTNFALSPPDDIVTLGTSRALVSVASATSLTVTVPEGATSGRVALRTPNGQASSTQDFFVLPAAYVVGTIDSTIRTVPWQSATVAINTPGHAGMLVFDGHAGEQISIVGIPGAPWRITLITPYGAVDVANPPCINSKAAIRETTLPVTGTYTILVDDPAAVATGSINVTVYDVSDVTLPITVGATVPVTTSIPGTKTRLTFSGVALQRVSLLVSNNSLTCCYSYVSISDPDGGYLHDPVRIDSDGFLDARTLPVSGVYTILLDPGVNTGTVTFSLQRLHAEKSGRMGIRRKVKIRKPGENAHITFNGTAGQQLRIARSNETLPVGSTDLTIFNPDGSMLVPPTPGASVSFTTPQSGTYEILVDPVGAVVGQLTLTLTNCSLGGC